MSENEFIAYAKSPTIGALAGALAKAQSEMRNPGFDKANPHFKNRYASLAATLDAVRAPLAKNGIALMQTVTTPAPDWVTVTTILAHSSGEWISCDFGGRAAPQIQQTGSTITYLRRYTLCAVLGVVGDDDDDGETDRTAERPKERPAPADPTFSAAEAKGLIKALAAKGLDMLDLNAAMKSAGLTPGEAITDWPVSWKPRIKAWLDTQPNKAAAAPSET